jgi:hypothetical protein
MKSLFTRVAFLLLLGAATFPAHAQFEKVPGFVKQFELGYGYSFCTADYILKASGVVPDGTRVVDTTITNRVHTKGGITETFGTSLKLKRLGQKSTLALGVDITYSGYIWDFHAPYSATLNDSGFHFNYPPNAEAFDGATFTAAVPITADFKFGADAMMDKRYRWGWTFGLGVMPSVSATAATGIDANISFGVQPVFKGEVALRGPIVAKLRLQYSAGNITYMDNSDHPLVAGTAQQQKIVGKSNFTVSILLLPLSFMYKKSMWYNSY